jgi:hypothetical protein
MPTGTFQAEGHIYTDDAGKMVPSVTQVITLGGLDELAGVPKRVLERPGEIGTAVHLATRFLDEGDLDVDSVDPQIAGYVLGWNKFKLEHDFSPIVIERRGISVDPGSGLAFGFCLDRIGVLGDRDVLLDIKTGSKAFPSWGVQTAGYAEASEFDGPRMSVHLADDGSYTIIPHEEADDFAQWHRALETAYWRLGHGAKIR